MLSFLIAGLFAAAATFETNELTLINPPAWITRPMVDRAIRRVEKLMEWDLRKVRAEFATTEAEFSRKHPLGAGVLAFSIPSVKQIVFGTATVAENFEEILGHELVHHVLAQKYKKSIPRWLEEGLANYVARTPTSRPVRYDLLKAQPDFDVRALEHPFLRSVVNVSVHYEASTALAEMLQNKCGLLELVRLSVGKNLETYLRTYCEIHDLNRSYREWVKQK